MSVDSRIFKATISTSIGIPKCCRYGTVTFNDDKSFAYFTSDLSEDTFILPYKEYLFVHSYKMDRYFISLRKSR